MTAGDHILKQSVRGFLHCRDHPFLSRPKLHIGFLIFQPQEIHLSCPSPNYMSKQETILFGLALFGGKGV